MNTCALSLHIDWSNHKLEPVTISDTTGEKGEFAVFPRPQNRGVGIPRTRKAQE
jgi:hypothetical protein